MKFFKHFFGIETNASDCCGVDLKEAEISKDESRC
jgi:hypothetical protein